MSYLVCLILEWKPERLLVVAILDPFGCILDDLVMVRPHRRIGSPGVARDRILILAGAAIAAAAPPRIKAAASTGDSLPTIVVMVRSLFYDAAGVMPAATHSIGMRRDSSTKQKLNRYKFETSLLLGEGSVAHLCHPSKFT